MFKIETAKANYEAETLAEIVAWQCEMQGAFAVIEHGTDRVFVDDVEFDFVRADEVESEIVALFEAERN